MKGYRSQHFIYYCEQIENVLSVEKAGERFISIFHFVLLSNWCSVLVYRFPDENPSLTGGVFKDNWILTGIYVIS